MDENKTLSLVEEIDKAKTSTKDLPYLCAGCYNLLGFIDSETRKVLRVKIRDFYIQITDAKQVNMTCRKCGLVNSLERDLK